MHYYYLHGAIDQASGPHPRLLAAWTETSGWQAEKQRAGESHRLWLGASAKLPLAWKKHCCLDFAPLQQCEEFAEASDVSRLYLAEEAAVWVVDSTL